MDLFRLYKDNTNHLELLLTLNIISSLVSRLMYIYGHKCPLSHDAMQTLKQFWRILSVCLAALSFQEKNHGKIEKNWALEAGHWSFLPIW